MKNELSPRRQTDTFSVKQEALGPASRSGAGKFRRVASPQRPEDRKLGSRKSTRKPRGSEQKVKLLISLSELLCSLLSFLFFIVKFVKLGSLRVLTENDVAYLKPEVVHVFIYLFITVVTSLLRVLSSNHFIKVAVGLNKSLLL